MVSEARPPRTQLKIVIVGHVDHGKSTLIGRLLYDTDSLPDGKVEQIKAMSERRGMAIEWSFVLDSFQGERDQAVTIDTTQIWFKTPYRDIVIIDAPGHREFLKNMVSGAALADAAVLVVDAGEGVREQTRRHAYLLHLLGLRQVVVVVNKMDLVRFEEQRYLDVRQEIELYLSDLGLSATAVIPISAREGDNLASPSGRMAWYSGPILTAALDLFSPLARPINRPLRFPVQDVYKFDERRIIAGRIESGHLQVGDTLLFSPSNLTARVKSIEAFGSADPPVAARAGQSIGITLDEQIFVERGDIASQLTEPPILTSVFRATVFWLGQTPLVAGNSYRLKLATRTVQVIVQAIEQVVDTQHLGKAKAESVKRNEVAEVVLRSRELLALDEHRENPATGRFVLVDLYDTVAGGIVSMHGYADQRALLTRRSSNLTSVDHLLTAQARAARNGHQGAVIWFTGLSGAGKSTLAMRVEQRLFTKGYLVYVLDGDNVRHGLNADLGFGPSDRAENIRRIAHVAALFADAGIVVITAFISPYRSDRDRARNIAPDRFHEIYIKADLSVCERRDPKGLYKRARAGEIQDFTGISSPYEAPDAAELVIDTQETEVEESVNRICAYIEERVRHR